MATESAPAGGNASATGTASATGDASHEWATGFVVFAAVWMIIVGALEFFQGLVALIDDEFYIVGPEYIYEFDLTTWGWIHLILGGLLFLVGLALLNGATWARWVGVVLAGLAIVANFLWLPYYPLWAILVIAAAAFVIWGLLTAPKDALRGR